MREVYLSVFFLLIAAFSKPYNRVHAEPQVPCYFIFGDSLVDGGRNNHLATTAKVNYWPYGIDFPGGPTGRFCNGRTTADVIGELLGFEDFIPAFPTASGSEILKGLNYASGSAGIRDETGKHRGVNVELNKQLKNHQVTVSRIVDILGSYDSAIKHLNKCLYSFVIGNNDYVNNYFLPKRYNTSRQYTPQQYAQVLIQQYSQQIKTVINAGARKVALTGIGPIGCTPDSIHNYDTKGSLCVDSMNDAANYFNSQLQSLVDQLSKDLTDAKFIYLNTYGIVSVHTPSPDIQINYTGCCPVNEYGQCIPAEEPCSDRDSYLFWDALHPTETANRLTGTISYQDLQKIL